MERSAGERLGQVIINLLTNAIHHNKDGSDIRISTGTENGSSVFKVANTGEGIAAEDLPNIFKRFYRADKSRAYAGGRSGLGLAICKAIVDAHGGNLEAASELNRVTTFTVRLPGASTGAVETAE